MSGTAMFKKVMGQARATSRRGCIPGCLGVNMGIREWSELYPELSEGTHTLRPLREASVVQG